MPKYLFTANYSRPEGVRGLLSEGGTSRRAAIDGLFTEHGGKLEAFYYAFGPDDVFAVGELPDQATAAALSLAVNASGSQASVTVLLTPEEIDEAAKKTVDYRPAGR